jgi:uncharacterized membrane protein YtjA (UPF0391 family)
MLRVALLILVIAVLAKLFGFGLLADAILATAQIGLFVVLAGLTVLGGAVRRF